MAGEDRIQRLARRAAAGDLAAARELVRELERGPNPDRSPGVRWHVVGPRRGRPDFIGSKRSRRAALALAAKLGADESGWFDMVREVRIEAPEPPRTRKEEYAVWALDRRRLLDDLMDADDSVDFAYEHPGYVSVTFEQGADTGYVEADYYELVIGWNGGPVPYGGLRRIGAASVGHVGAGYMYDRHGDLDDQVLWIAETARRAHRLYGKRPDAGA